jgi:hypothetical protein
MDIKNSSPYSHNSDSGRIGCGNYPHHFHPYMEVMGDTVRMEEEGRKDKKNREKRKK